MNDLLKRQGSCLLMLHDSIIRESPAKHVVNEALLQQRLDDLLSIAMTKLYAYRYDLLPYHWRQLYTDSIVLATYYDILKALSKTDWLHEEVVDGIVEKLDRALVTTGGAGGLGGTWIEQTLQLLEKLCNDADQLTEARPSKRAKIDASGSQLPTGRAFSAAEPHGRPTMLPDRTCPRCTGWSIDRFEKYMNDKTTHVRPIVFTDLMGSWPALTERPWKSPDYLLSKTFGGRRLVPVEVGRSYVDDGWGQELIPFKKFLSKYVDSSQENDQVGYLAQHNLFHQIPSLRNDIAIPDFCWSSVPPHPTDPSKNKAPVDMPQLNAWFGPARTITPLHTDAYHNLLAQVVGKKYVRLYPPQATERMRPRGEEDGVDMSNTSALDIGVLEGWDECDETVEGEDLERLRRNLEGVEYWECVLEEGDTLLVPMGWWHYVRSLSVSFSVSFWWN